LAGAGDGDLLPVTDDTSCRLTVSVAAVGKLGCALVVNAVRSQLAPIRLAKELLLDLVLSFLYGVTFGVLWPDDGSLLSSETLEEERGRFARPMLSEEGAGEAPRTALRCKSRASKGGRSLRRLKGDLEAFELDRSALRIVIGDTSRAERSVAGEICFDGVDMLSAPSDMPDPRIPGDPLITMPGDPANNDVVDLFISRLFAASKRADWKLATLADMDSAPVEPESRLRIGASSALSSTRIDLKIALSKSSRMARRWLGLDAFRSLAASSMSSSGTVTVVRLWSRIPSICISYILHRGTNRS